MAELETPAVQAAKPETPPVPEPPKEAPKQEPVKEEPKAEIEYVTKEQLASIKDEIIRDVNMRSKQRAQEIKKQVNSIQKTLQASGIEVTDEQKEKIETQVAAQFSDDTEEEETPAAPKDIPPYAAAAIDMMKDAKVDIEAGDPEFEQYIKPHLNNPGPALLRDTAKAIESKQARTLQNKEKAPLRTPAGGGDGPGEFVAKDAKGYWNRAHSK